MRRLIRLIALFVLLVGLGFSLYGHSPSIVAFLAKAYGDGPVDPAPLQGSIVYRLDDRSWVKFPFARAPKMIRILAHADTPETAIESPDAFWTYGFQYEVRDAIGRVLLQGEVSLAAKVPFYFSEDGSQLLPSAAYADSKVLPSATDPVQLDLSDAAHATEIRLRAMPLKDGVTAVAVRVYERRAITEGRYDLAWQRLSSADRTRLAQGSAIPAGLLTASERDNLLKNQWLPIGPSGVEGNDYHQASLRALDETFAGVRAKPAPVEPGVYLDATLRTTLSLPENGSVLRFATGATDGDTRLTLTWYGQGTAAREIREEVLGSQNVSRPIAFSGGLLEISSDKPVRLRIWQEPPNADELEVPAARNSVLQGDTASGLPQNAIDLTSELTSMRVYGFDQGSELRYKLSSLSNQSTPFRLALRCQCVQGKSPAPVKVHYAILDQDGAAIHDGEIRWIPVASPYDRLRDAPEIPLSDPEQIFFNLPPEAVSLRLTATQPILAAAYNRPPDLVRRFQVPEDDFALSASEIRRLTWFGLRPEGADTEIELGRAPIILVPARPPQDNPEIVAGRYVWEQFQPDGDWLARDLLVPRGKQQSTRAEALSSVFVPVRVVIEGTQDDQGPIGREFKFVSAIGSDQVMPELVFLRDRADPMTLSVHVDGNPFHTTSIAAARGLIALPPMPVGIHWVDVMASAPLAAYINQVETSEGSLLRRRALRLGVGETRFQIEKRGPGEELLVGHVYPQGPETGRVEVRMTLEGLPRALGPLSDWTLADRSYSLRLVPAARDIPVLGSDQLVGPDRTVLMVMGSDIPPGTYMLRVELTGQHEVYLALSRALPGVEDSRAFFQE